MDWKNDYIELFFPSYGQVRNESAADELKFKNRPKSLFKYKGVNEDLFPRYLEEIENDAIWLSRPDCFNDPYECFFKRDYQKVMIKSLHRMHPGFRKAIDQYFPDGQLGENPAERLMLYVLAKQGDFSKRSLDDLRDSIKDISIDKHRKEMNDTWKICCFSERNNSIPMWAHYADEHAGFCLEYDLSKQPKELIKHLYPVIYTSEIVDITKELSELTDGWGIKPIIHKSKDWSYEEEWRFILVTPPKDLKGVLVKFFPVTGIYLGTKISVKNKKALCEIALKKNIPVYGMKLSESKFEFEPCSL